MKTKKEFFFSITDDGAEYNGQGFEIIAKIDDGKYLIRFDDGYEIDAFESEVFEPIK